MNEPTSKPETTVGIIDGELTYDPDTVEDAVVSY